METRDRGDPTHFFALEPLQRAVQDQVMRVSVMFRAIDGCADVMKERRAFEELSLDAAETVSLGGGVEKLERELGDVLAVIRVGIDQRGEIQDGASTSLGQAPSVCLSGGFGGVALRMPRAPFGGRSIWKRGVQNASERTARTLRAR